MANNIENRYSEYSKKSLVSPKNQTKYKYNAFSAIDQAVNSRCGSCGPN